MRVTLLKVAEGSSFEPGETLRKKREESAERKRSYASGRNRARK
jgi:hypothetical protein